MSDTSPVAGLRGHITVFFVAGNYERFVGVTLTRDHNITTGKIYKQCIERERRGDYLGKTVQVWIGLAVWRGV